MILILPLLFQSWCDYLWIMKDLDGMKLGMLHQGALCFTFVRTFFSEFVAAEPSFFCDLSVHSVRSSILYINDWKDCTRTIAYTNHTVLPEALEKWSQAVMWKLLPRHMEIVGEIDKRVCSLPNYTLPPPSFPTDSFLYVDVFCLYFFWAWNCKCYAVYNNDTWGTHWPWK